MLTCVVIPHYDHVEQFQKMLPELTKQGLPLLVVDDASPASAFDALRCLLDVHAPDSKLIRHAENTGKGGAVMTGLKAALDAGYTHALQIDADGQHDVADIRLFCAAATQRENSIICGEPVFDESISRLRFYARYITLWLVWLETLSTEIHDALCGIRLYPLGPVVTLIEKSQLGKRMAFDPEIFVRAVWAGIELHYIAVRVKYPEGGKSHFYYLRDNIEITWMHIRLIFGMLLRSPGLVARRWSRRADRDAR